MSEFSRCCVITPSFNPGRFLMPMLESVASQKNVIIQHIVYDGGSTDGSIEKLAAWQQTHDGFFWVSEADEGQADALGKALAHVNTPFFGWLNADDFYTENALAVLLKEAKGFYKQYDQLPSIVYGDYVRVDEEGNTIALRQQPSFNRWDCLHGYITIQNAAAIFNTELLRKSGGFDKKWRFVMDYDIILKLSKAGSVLHVPKVCGAFRHHAEAKTSTLDSVCQRETSLLRMEYGGSPIPLIAKFLQCIAKARVAARMAREGVLSARW